MSPKFSVLTIVVLAFFSLSIVQVHCANSPILKRKKKSKKGTRRVSEQGAEKGSYEKRASPFGQIEKVFGDTLKEDEAFGRKLQVEPLSFDFLVVEPGKFSYLFILILT